MRTWIGSALTTLGGLWGIFCPACVPAVAVLFTSIGLGFLSDFFVSRGVMLVMLAIAFVALHVSARVHGRTWVFALAVASGMLAIFARNVYLNQTLVYLSGAGLFTAALLDFRYRRQGTVATCAVPSAASS